MINSILRDIIKENNIRKKNNNKNLFCLFALRLMDHLDGNFVNKITLEFIILI